MRIIGGTAGGRRIRAPRGQATRPTSDRVREAIFNILGPPPPGARVLDLYAGAGGLGLEALSRGATAAVFVDEAAAAYRCIRENADRLGFGERARVVKAPVQAALARLAATGQRFEWIFADPPYATDEAARTVAALGGPHAALLAPGAVLVVEHDRRRPPPERAGVLARTDIRVYGDTAVSFYEKEPEHPTGTSP